MKEIWSDAVLAAVRSGDRETLLRLDRLGLPAAPGESGDAFADRLARLGNAARELRRSMRRDGKVEPLRGMTVRREDEIPRALQREACAVTEKLYGIRPEWVPGFFVRERFGFLWGGCSLSDAESGLNLFIIRPEFRKRRRWLFYDRVELLAHELCHAAHQALNEERFEEYFAYRTARSRLRRRFGNCFVHGFDAWLFLLPVLLLPVMQLLQVTGVWRRAVWPFWVFAGVYPVFLLLRNARTQNLARRAEENLKRAGVAAPGAVLFRLAAAEIAAVAREKDAAEVLRKICAKDLRGAALERFWSGREDVEA